jgi:hypothetical protein
VLFFFDKNEILRGFVNPADGLKLIEKSYVPELSRVSWQGTNKGNLFISQSLNLFIIKTTGQVRK